MSSQHKVAVLMEFGDDGTFVGLQRVQDESRKLLGTQKQLTDAELKAATAEKKSADAKRAATLATKAGSDAARSAAQAKVAEARAANADEAAAAALARVQAQLAAATARATREQTLSEKALRENTAAMRRQAEATDDINKKLSAGIGLVKAFFAAWVAREALSATKSLLTTGFEFNALMETSQRGIAALLLQFGQLTDNNGRVLEGVEAINAANRIAIDIQNDLRVATLKTWAEYPDALRTLQEGLAPAIAAAFDDKQVIRFSQAVMNAAMVMGIPGNQMGQEVRGIFEGDTNAKVSRIAASLFSGMDNVPAKLEELRKSGELFDFLMEKLAAFERVGEGAADTYTGAMSNLRDAVQQALGEATQGPTKDLTKLIKDLTTQIVTFDETGNARFNPTFVNGLRSMAEMLVDVTSRVTQLISKVGELTLRWRAIKLIANPDDREVMSLMGYDAKLNDRDIASVMAALSARDARAAVEEDALRRSQDEMFRREGERLRGVGAQRVSVSPDGRQKVSADTLDFEAVSGFGGGGSGWAKFETELGRFSSEHSTKTAALIREINAAARDGSLTLKEFNVARQTVLRDANLSGPRGGISTALTSAQESALASFRRFMEPFHQKAAAGEGTDDAISEKLLAIHIKREQAIAKLQQTRKKLGEAAEDWDRDLADINATFDKEETAVLDEAFQKFGKFSDWAQQYEPAPPDPLTEDLLKIRKQRADALRELEKQKKEFGDVAAVDWQQLAQNINTHFDQEERQAQEKRFEAAHALFRSANERTILEVRENVQLQAKIEIDAKAEAEEARIALITDSIERENAQRQAANERWAAQEKARIEATYKNEVLKKKALATIDAALDEANRRSDAAAQRAREAQIAGTEAWMNDLSRRLAERAVPIGLAIQDAVVEGLDGVSTAIDELFASVADGQLDLGGTLQGLQENLESTWSKVLSSMLTNTVLHGASLKDQFNQIFAGITGPGSAFLAGAGIGGTLGGFFQKPGNHASEGGAIGGGIGALLGAWFTAGNPAGIKWGTTIGSTIGTWIGAGIQKGEDHIKVSVSKLTLAALRRPLSNTWGPNSSGVLFDGGGMIDVEEKGISDEARNDVLEHVRRRVRDVLKGYDAIFKLLPQHVRDAIASLPPPELDLTGGIGFEEGDDKRDIANEDAISSLGEFLNDKLGKAAFTAYSGAIRTALTMMGLNDGKVTELFTEWGTLQGEELQEAVGSYVSALVEFSNIRSKISQGPTMTLDAARNRMNETDITRLSSITGDIREVFDTLGDAIDVDDQLSAMQQLNQLSTQFYESMESALIRINQSEDAMHDSFARQREQIELAGMSKQEKMDYYYQQMADIRANLSHATDPGQIEELTRRLQEYVSAAMGLDPENADNRQRLLDILGDIEGMGSDQYNKARDQVLEEQKEAAEMLAEAARLLLLAAGGSPDLPDGGEGPGGGNDDGNGENPHGDDDPGRGGGGRDGGVNRLVAAIERNGEADKESGARMIELLAAIAAPAEDETGTSRAAELQRRQSEMVDLLEAMQQMRVRVEVVGDGAEFMRQMGMEIRDDVIYTMIDLLRSNADAARGVNG